LKLASLKNSKSKDGELVVVSHDNQSYISATDVAPNLLNAIEHWQTAEPLLQKKYQDLNQNKISGAVKITDEKIFESCLPRTWLFADGSAFIHHIKLVRQARKAELPATLLTTPLMYQAESGRFMAPTENIPQIDFAHGTDFEAEVGVIVDFVPKGISAEQALAHIKLCVILNDVSLRGLIPEELASGFGFFQSKPNKTLSPFAVTVDELGGAWKNGRIHLPLLVDYTGQFFGKANAKEMHFHFGQLIAHAARTRDLAAGTLIGSGTVSNEDMSMGSCCLVEKRTLEQIHQNEIKTPYMSAGDTIEIKMLGENGENIFGRIYQKVEKHKI
jgi:fumarylacetoacetate (FAA) hydrolase